LSVIVAPGISLDEVYMRGVGKVLLQGLGVTGIDFDGI
jgi:hypothetical protein